jgi:DNA (cytosine-5)-methyltransferase 1
LDDPRADTLSAYLRVVEEALPRAFVLENVEGLAFQGKDEGLRLLLERIEGINRRTRSKYAPHHMLVNAAEHGVPQLRQRFVLVAARDGAPFELPRPTLSSFRTAWDALGDLAVPGAEEDLAVRGKWAALLPSIPEGQNYLWHTDRGGGLPLFGWRRRYWTFLLKLAKNRPSWTIQAQPGPAVGPFHWDNRRLSMRELCRLQTFPDDVVIHGNRQAIQRQIGNAVPSLLAEVLGRAIRTQILGERLRTTSLKLLPPKREPVPEPEKVHAVPRQYQALVGRHEAHPGTGKGFAAVARGGEAA